MEHVSIEVQNAPAAASLAELERELVRFNQTVAPPEGYAPLAVFARSDGRLVAGVSGFTHWGWLFIEHMWVDGDHRRRGLGRRVLDEFEAIAIDRGTHHARVTTFEFQSRDFYTKVGHEVFAELPDYPVGGRLFFLSKPLEGGAVAAAR